jgi:hypothetical protein
MRGSGTWSSHRTSRFGRSSRQWVRVVNKTEFDTLWTDIKMLAPPLFVAYLVEYWMPKCFIAMWSAIFQKDRTIFKISDTNMLVEACIY